MVLYNEVVLSSILSDLQIIKICLADYTVTFTLEKLKLNVNLVYEIFHYLFLHKVYF